jgi:predicted dehydrogenase
MVNFGIVGFGLHAVKRLMPGFALASNCRVTALSRRDMGKAQASAGQFDIPLAFDSAEQLSRSPEVDAVLVTTPNACHLDDVLIAIRAGKPVLCEKPMAVNSNQCRQMVEAARRAGVLLGVAQVFRFEESTARLRSLVAEGKIGKPIFARSEFSFQAKAGHARTWMNNAGVAGGGPIADVGVHCIDALRFILQDEVVRVGARAQSDEQSGDIESAATLTLEFSRGVMASVMVSFRADYRTPFEFVGEMGAVSAVDAFTVEKPVTIELQRGGKVEAVIVSNKLAYAKQVDAFAEAIEGRTLFAVPGEEGWKNQLVIDAAYRSIKSEKFEMVGIID